MEFRDWGVKALDFIEKPIEEDAFINILEGSVRSGKTVAMIPKWLNYIMTGPPGLLLMTGVSKDTIYDNVLNDLFDTIGEENYHYNRQSGSLDVFWRDADGEHMRRIKVVGAKDEGSEKFIRGKTLAGAYCDELTLMPERFFKQLLNRLSVPGAKLYSTTNPDSPMHYIDTEERILRKGAIAAHAGERVLIPINMRDGSILAVGRGDPDWNWSAPHGAGRLMSRSAARENLSMDEFRATMAGVYTTAVNENTLDEAPMAYKALSDILGIIEDSVDVIEVLKPIYNFKAG